MHVHAQDDTALSLEAVYRAHARSVARWAARLAGPGLDLDDLVHEVFIVVEEQLPGFRGDAKLTTWLYRITANVVRYQRRKNRLFGWLATDDDPLDRPTDAPSPHQTLERKESIQLVYKLLNKMSEKYRTALILHEFEGLTGPEIAELTGVKESTVWVRLHRGRARFAELLDKESRRRA